MSERNNAVSAANRCIKEAVCIHTDKVYDSCRDKECLENVRVYLTSPYQDIVDRAINIKCRKAEVIWVYSDVEPVPFNEGFFTVDIKFFFRVALDVFTGIGTPTTVYGLATFDKKVVLFGSEGKAKIFSSKFKDDGIDPQMIPKTNLPMAVVEVVDPICLNAKIVEKHHHHHECEDQLLDVAAIPDFINNCFEGEFVELDPERRVLVTLGLFSIIKIERKVQLLIPVFDFCIPDKECVAATAENPCELFDTIRFPIDEFFPPQKDEFLAGERREGNDSRGCGC